MVSPLTSKVTLFKNFKNIPQESFEIEVICKGLIPPEEEEYLIGKDDIQYLNIQLYLRLGMILV